MTAHEPHASPAIIVDDVSVRYTLPGARPSSLKEFVVGKHRGAERPREHEALRGVSLRIDRGQAVAIIGPNGSGKTTLLRLIARVLAPSSGRVRTFGRVAPILDVVGALHPDLTGIENIYLNGTLLGLDRKAVAARVETITAFAELGEFIQVPMRTYSSGMVARLGFAIASDTNADILVIDEALGVGDERFQRKCAARIDALLAAGVTFLLVSHDMHAVQRLCTRAIWLEAGSIRMDGPAPAVVAALLEANR